MKFKFLITILFAAVVFMSCSKDEDPDVLIEQYLEDNNLTAEKTSEGLYVVVENEGTGKRPSLSDEVKVHYHGELLNGDVFDSSIQRGDPATFPLSAVILGWQIGIPMFKEGGNGKLIIPPSLGYGGNPPRGSIIPKDAVLVFDVELLKVQ